MSLKRLKDLTERAASLMLGRLEEAEGDGHWITIRGSHVYVYGGKVIRGPASLRGRSVADVSGPPASRERISFATPPRKTITGEPYYTKMSAAEIEAARKAIDDQPRLTASEKGKIEKVRISKALDVMRTGTQRISGVKRVTEDTIELNRPLKPTEVSKVLTHFGSSFSFIHAKRGGEVKVGKGFFYRSQQTTSDRMMREVKTYLPDAEMVDEGENWAAFRGGAEPGSKHDSYTYVTFKPGNRVKFK